MRAFVMFLFVAFAVPCYAEDPLETLNTIEDTLTTMEQTLQARSESKGAGIFAGACAASERLPLDDRLFFISDQALGGNDWVAVRPCTEELALAEAASDAQSCVRQPDGTVAMGDHFWKSRPAATEDLQVGALVVAREPGETGWFVAKITDISDLNSGYVATSASFRTPVRGMRVVE